MILLTPDCSSLALRPRSCAQLAHTRSPLGRKQGRAERSPLRAFYDPKDYGTTGKRSVGAHQDTNVKGWSLYSFDRIANAPPP